ncbi:multiple sugar transport system permease protein/putative aldouronate transport system permease protein [Anaerotaenia torta]|uniref:ABC transporter permease n=1 Tax=Anaerotaenia torta TaxID=433293 RepID=UPI003D254D28
MKEFWRNTWKHRAHLIMCIPVILVLFLFSYMPMAGLVMAFKKFDYGAGIWKSPWVGLNNFKFLLASGKTFWRMTSNTLSYYAVFTILGTLLNIAVAIGIDQLVFKRMGKAFQSIMIIPVFISYAAVQFIVYAFFSNNGMVNNIMQMFGADAVRWYTNPKHWPMILTIVKMWNSVGYGSVLYMSVLAGIDQEMYEAAQIDGANKRRQIYHITLPCLVPMITIMLLLSVGGIMRSETGLFYQVTRNSGIIYSTTQVIDSYVLNALLTTPDYGFTAAATFYQSIVGLALILVANGIVRKAAPENSLF